MRRGWLLLALFCAGCGAAPSPEPATQETAVLIFGSGRPARGCLRAAYQSLASKLPKPLSAEPGPVAARMVGGLERAAQEEKARHDAEQRKRDAEFEESMQRFRSLGTEGFGGVGLGGLGGLGQRGGGSGAGLGGLGTGRGGGGIGTLGPARPKSKPKKK